MQKESELAGIDKNVLTDIVVGTVVGVAILFLGFLVPGIGSIGVPSLPQSLSGTASRAIVIIGLASIFETFGFFDIILSFFFVKMRRFGLKMPFIISAILTSLVFSGFHLASYGNFASSSGAFVSAFLMGLVFCYERKFTNSNIPGIITHGILNWWIGFGSLSIIVSWILTII